LRKLELFYRPQVPVENTHQHWTWRFVMSQYADFRERAEQCMQLEKQARNLHDREFFHKMAMAWLGRIDESRSVQRRWTEDRNFWPSRRRSASIQRQTLQ
jgi:hypothetical protein